MNLLNEPPVNEFRSQILQAPGGDIAVSLERLKLDMRYGGLSRDFFRLFILSIISFLREESFHV